jgi:hypothetical protein
MAKIDRIIRKAGSAKFIQDYNNVIPRSALDGATPFEVFSGKWTITEHTALDHLNEAAQENRRNANLRV